jgi:hypothetical protein
MLEQHHRHVHLQPGDEAELGGRADERYEPHRHDDGQGAGENIAGDQSRGHQPPPSDPHGGRSTATLRPFEAERFVVWRQTWNEASFGV